jgi:hypothetical protein
VICMAFGHKGNLSIFLNFIINRHVGLLKFVAQIGSPFRLGKVLGRQNVSDGS